MLLFDLIIKIKRSLFQVETSPSSLLLLVLHTKTIITLETFYPLPVLDSGINRPALCHHLDSLSPVPAKRNIPQQINPAINLFFSPPPCARPRQADNLRFIRILLHKPRPSSLCQVNEVIRNLNNRLSFWFPIVRPCSESINEKPSLESSRIKEPPVTQSSAINFNWGLEKDWRE